MKDWEIEKNVDLKKYNTYGIGGKAKYLIRPKTIEELIQIIDYSNDHSIPFIVIGGGSNIIIPDSDYEGIIIKLDYLNYFNVNNDVVFLGAGLNLTGAVSKLINLGYVNFTSLYGIPGTLGGAIIGNAGAYNYSIFDDLLSVLVLDNGVITLINKSNIEYGYRYTEFKNSKKIILGATFKLQKGDKEKALETIKENMQKRREKQPLDYKNAGSVFKNPEGMAAGKIIEDLGLKKLKVNDAMVSDKHANFIINLKNAKSSDIISLIELIKEKAKKEKNIDLELEQVIFKW